MNNLKKIGVSALAGSLMAFSSATAGEMAVSGTAEVTYTSADTASTTGGRSTSGNPIGFKNNLSFKGSGDVNGYAVSFNTAMNDAMSGVSSSLLTVDMGAMGLVGLDNGTGSFGIDTADDSILPTAYEEPSHGGGTGSLGRSGSNNVIGYKNTFSGVSLNLEYNADYTTGGQVGDGATSGATADDAGTTSIDEAIESANKGSSTNFVLSYAPIDGLVVGAGHGTTQGHIQAGGITADAVEMTAYTTYAVGSFSAGYFVNESQNNTTASAGKNTDGYSLAMAVNENLSISYAEREVEFDKPSASVNVTEDSTGIMASYTMGGASVRIANNEHDNAGGTTNSTTETTEISLVLAF